MAPLLSSSLDAQTIRQVPYAFMCRAREAGARLSDESDLVLLDDVIARGLLDNGTVEPDTSDCAISRAAPHALFTHHLMAHTSGWSATVEYEEGDARLPESVREFHRVKGVKAMVVTPLVVGATNLGWIKLSSRTVPECPDAQWWRVKLIEA